MMANTDKKIDDAIRVMEPDELSRYAAIMVHRLRHQVRDGIITEEEADRKISEFVNRYVNPLSTSKRFSYTKNNGIYAGKELLDEWMSIYYHDTRDLANLLELAIHVIELLLVESTIRQATPKNPVKVTDRWLERQAEYTGHLISRLNNFRQNLYELQTSKDWGESSFMPEACKVVKTPDEVLAWRQNPEYRDPATLPYVSLLEHSYTSNTGNPPDPDTDYAYLWYDLFCRLPGMKEPHPVLDR